MVELQADFAAALPGRLAQLEALVARIREAPQDAAAVADVQRFLHKIEGSAESYGFKSLGAIARVWHQRFRPLENAAGPLPETWADNVEELLSAMRAVSTLGAC